MLTGVHILLTYRCTYECPHCFVYSSPRARGTFTHARILDVLDQAQRIEGVEWIYFEGGEAFLYYPLLLAGLQSARERGFRLGVVTNAYWAESPEDAALWLRPIADLGVEDLSLSDDAFHGGEDNPGPGIARAAAEALGLPVGVIAVPEPHEGEGVKFCGRAADELVEGLPRAPSSSFTTCPFEDLAAPGRVHVDPYGHVHLCQGILLGNLFDTPLDALMTRYDAAAHPICGPILRGGPAALAETHDVAHGSSHVAACHLCYEVRKTLRPHHPDLLGPPQVYGENDL